MKAEDVVSGKEYRIRQWNDMEEDFGVNSCGSIDVPAGFTPNMEEFCGSHVTIAFSGTITDASTLTHLSGIHYSVTAGIKGDIGFLQNCI